MKLPSCTDRTRSGPGLKVTVRDTVAIRGALVTEMGTVYGPPPTRNSVPGAVTATCATLPGGAASAGCGSAPGGVVALASGGGTGVSAGAWGCVCGGVWVGGDGSGGSGTTPGEGSVPGRDPGVVAGDRGSPAGGVVPPASPPCGAISGGGPPSPRFCCVPM